MPRRSQRKIPARNATRGATANPQPIDLASSPKSTPQPRPLAAIPVNTVRPSPRPPKTSAASALMDGIQVQDMSKDAPAMPATPASSSSAAVPQSLKRKTPADHQYRLPPPSGLSQNPLPSPSAIPSSSRPPAVPAVPALLLEEFDYDSDDDYNDDDDSESEPRSSTKAPKLPRLGEFPDLDGNSFEIDRHIRRNDASKAKPDFSTLLASIPLDDDAPVGTRKRRLVRKKDFDADDQDEDGDPDTAAPATEEEIRLDQLKIEEAAKNLDCRKMVVKHIRKEEIIQVDERGEAISGVVADVHSEEEVSEDEGVAEQLVEPPVSALKKAKKTKTIDKSKGLLGLLEDDSSEGEDESMQLRRPEPAAQKKKFKKPRELTTPRDKDDEMEWINQDQLGKKNGPTKQYRDVVEEIIQWRVRGMTTPLLPHQVLGVDWMVDHEFTDETPRGGLVADAMGLGKTIQAIATMVKNPPVPDEETGKYKNGEVTLIVAPVALLQQWKDEIVSHTQKKYFQVRIHHGKEKIKTLKELKKQDVVITTYGALMRSYPNPKPPKKMSPDEQAEWFEEQWENRGMFHRMKFWRVILDECHIIKNRRSRTSLACQELLAHHTWALSGTPFHNGLDDIFPIFKFIDHPYAGVLGHFESMMKGDMGTRAQRVQAILRSVMMRRTKEDFLLGKPLITLPKKYIKMVVLEFGTEERNLYMAVEKQSRDQINKFIRKGTVTKNYSHILTMLLRLRQICNHPYLILNTITDGFSVDDLDVALQGADDDAAADGLDGKPFDMREFVRGGQPKASGLRKVLEAAKTQVKVYGDAKECAICFDVWAEPVMGNCRHGFCRECIESHLTARAQEGAEGNCPMCSQPLKNSDLQVVPAQESPEADDDEDWLDSCGEFMHSAKTLALKDQIAEWRQNHPEDHVVLFSQFTKMLDIVEKVCDDEGWTSLRYQGDMSIAQREDTLQEFRRATEPRILLMSLKAGGVGLNLVKANLVISLDLWWCAAPELQAFDRVHRLGQLKEVFVTRFVVKNTVEERILALQKDKLKIAAAAMGEGAGKLGKLSIHELVGLFGRVVHDNNGEAHLEADYDAGLLRQRAREVARQRHLRPQ